MQRGFTLIELALVAALIALALSVMVKTFDVITQSERSVRDASSAHYFLVEKMSQIRSIGYWVWDVELASPRFSANPHDPAIKWQDELSSSGISSGNINVTFLKESGGSLVPFSSQPFDQNTSRGTLKVTVSLEDPSGDIVSEEMVLSLRPIQKDQEGVLILLKQALEIYYVENNAYPDSLGALVPTILDEIPNDPMTNEFRKVTHVEELMDWGYSHDSGSNMLSLYPYSRPELGINWTY